MKAGQSRDWLIVDGYNVIGAWQDMRALAADNLAAARDRLADQLLDYCGHSGQTLLLVFDAHSTNEPQREQKLTQEGEHAVVFTRRGQTADNYIERFVRAHSGQNMTVASSDALVQVMVFMHAARISSRELQEAIESMAQAAKKHYGKESENGEGLLRALSEQQFRALNALRYRDKKG